MGKVVVTQKVLEGLEAVRRSGLTSMRDLPVVAIIARRLGYEATARWVEDNPIDFGAGLLYGFEATSKSKEEENHV